MNENHENCVYKLTSPSGKVYIGQSINFNKRMNEHMHCKDERCPKLYRAIKKYGWENFKKEILSENLSIEQMNVLEECHIREYDSIKNGYNVTIGGCGIRGENGRCVLYGTGKYGVTKDDLGSWRHARYFGNHEKVLKQQRENYNKHVLARRESARKNFNSMSEEEHRAFLNKLRCFADGSKMMFEHVPNKDAFRRIFIDMFGGGRTYTSRRYVRHHGLGYVDEWGDWLYKV